jgi:hypothetical protein
MLNVGMRRQNWAPTIDCTRREEIFVDQSLIWQRGNEKWLLPLAILCVAIYYVVK